jgi:hypothetical protein
MNSIPKGALHIDTILVKLLRIWVIDLIVKLVNKWIHGMPEIILLTIHISILVLEHPNYMVVFMLINSTAITDIKIHTH